MAKQATPRPKTPRKPRAKSADQSGQAVPETVRLVNELHEQLFFELTMMDDHRQAAVEAYLYMYARQRYFPDDPDGFQIILNSTQPDISRKVAKILDSEPTIEARGRGAEDFEMGMVWKDLLSWTREWTGDRYDSWMEIQPKVYFQQKLVGDGIVFVGWDQYEEDGLGMVVHERVDSLHFVWDSQSQSMQLRDARRVFWFEPKDLTWLDEEFPEFTGQFIADAPGLLQTAILGAGDAALEDEAMEDEALGAAPSDLSRRYLIHRPEQAYLIKRWEKKRITQKRYLDKETSKPATVPGEDEALTPLTEEIFKGLPEGEKAKYEPFEVKVTQLWETWICNHHVLKHQLSPYDKANGGHGHYPFARCSNIWDPRTSRSHGDVAFYQGMEDLQSQMATRWIESVFIANSTFMDVVQGAYRKGEEAKLDDVGRVTMQKIMRNPGMPPAQFVNTNPSGANLLAAGQGFLQQLQDKAQSYYSVQRGDMPYQTSGKGIRELLAEAAISDNLDRLRVESFLRQVTWLEIALIQQYFSANRMMRITNRAKKDEYMLYIGKDELETKSLFKLKELFREGQENPETGMPAVEETGLYQDPQGRKARVLTISNKDVGKFDIRLKLEAGRERNKAERENMVQMFMEMAAKGVHPQLIQWAGNLLQVENEEGLIQAVGAISEETQMVQQMDQIMQASGMSFEEIGQMAVQMGARKKEPIGKSGGGGGAAMAGAPAAPAAPAAPGPLPPQGDELI